MRFLIKTMIYVLIMGIFPANAATDNVTEQHRRALAMAREGGRSLQQAVPEFKRLLQQNPDNILILYDYIAVLGWSSDDKAVLQLLPRVDIGEAPVYVLEALGRSARNQRDFGKAVYFYQQGIRRFPQHLPLQVGLGLAFSDNKQHQLAIKHLQNVYEQHHKNIEVMFALAYAYRAVKQPVDALGLYEKILDLEPNNRDAWHLKILAAYELGAPHRALELAKQHPNLLSEAEYRKLLADRAAIRTRWGAYVPETEAQRYDETDLALNRLDAYDQHLAQGGEKADSLLRHRVRFDKMVALRDRVKMTEVIQEYEYFMGKKIQVPCYAQIAAADAYLYVEQPETARDIYIDVLSHCQKEFDTHLALFYAHVESEQWDEAFKLIDAMNQEEPAWLKTFKGKTFRQNPDKLTADVTAAMARAYAGYTDQAQQRLEQLLAVAPFNNDQIRTSLAHVYRWRGWPEKAKEQYELALATQPENVQTKVGYAHALMDSHEYKKAEPMVKALKESHPENKSVQELAWFWKLHNSWELTIDAVFNLTGSQFGNKDHKIDSYLYAPPLLQRYTPYVHSFYAKTKFSEGTESYRRVGAGLQYQGKHLFLAGELSQEVGDEWGDDLGSSVFASWRFDDQWQLHGRADSFATDIPLQARYYGIDGRMGEISLDYTAHDMRNANLTAQVLDFSDGNMRQKLSGHIEQRLLTQPLFTFDGKVEAYASQNSLNDDRPYFNPVDDLSLGLAANADHIIYRRYDRVLRHRLIPAWGNYWQHGYQDDWYGILRYEHDWLLSETFKFLYGVSRSRMVYDGQPEYATYWYLTVDWRF